ncbi:MAG: Rieske (2Fe-2S) protein [Caulobacteraceae bacterium]|jgi:phenylpropionate dioxygenase-like ring-hydroxylating dioxygenase large terminal subunit|nr:Rieske (2Fe-2S) protein [Caulobacteraceae bacterium]
MFDRHIPETMAQCSAINYQEILDTDTRPVPDCLRERSVPDIGTKPVSVEHYTSPEVFQRSISKVWLRTWQMACREEEIPLVGDYQIYDVVGKSLIIVRSGPDEIRALHNSCLHRGRKLVTQNGSKREFRCPFHGFTWAPDGAFLFNPVEWDFPQCSHEQLRLPEAKVARWGGFVFINFDPGAPSLDSVIDPIPRHFDRWVMEDKYIFAHVAKRAKANWMIAQEAFMETHHSIGTHPQIMPFITDANAQYDIFSDHVTRHISGRGHQSPFITDRVLTQDEIANALLNQGVAPRGAAPNALSVVPEGMTARSYVAEIARASLQQETGYDLAETADCELGDSLIYNLFPNLSVWGGAIPNLVYRWRPVGRRHDESMMEIYILKRVPKGDARPRPARMQLLGDDEPWASADNIGGLGPVVDQDWANMEAMQEGLAASEAQVVQLGHYLEMRIRQHHATFDAYCEESP